MDTQAAAPPGVRSPSRRPGSLGRALARWPLAALGAAALFAAYLRVSWTQPVNSDGASNALQAWDMLHGNLLLHGWWLSDVSFFTTELPQYALVEAVRGLNAGVVHVAAAMTYTLLVALSALLARGGATGREAAARMALAAGIVLAPQLGAGAYVLLLSPDHVGTSVLVLATWLVLDRAGRRRWVPVTVGALLACGLVADGLVLYIAVIPLAGAGALRVSTALVVRRRPPAGAWFELALVAAAGASVPAAMAAAALLRAHGGYQVWGTRVALTAAAGLPRHAWLALNGVAVLYGASFTGLRPGLAMALAALHLAGLALAGWAVWLGLRRFGAGTGPVTDALTAAVVLNVLLYLASNRVADLRSARDMAAVLPFGAVLAGRLLGGRLLGGRLLAGHPPEGRWLGGRRLGGRPGAARVTPLLAAVLLGYTAALAYDAAQAPVPAANTGLVTWLAGHHLRYGVGNYWDANSVSLASGGSVQIRPVCSSGRRFTAYRWESQAPWYDPAHQRADFLVLAPHPGFSCFSAGYPQVAAVFGRPAHAYRVGRDTVLVWDTNLLGKIGVARTGGPVSRGPAAPPSPR